MEIKSIFQLFNQIEELLAQKQQIEGKINNLIKPYSRHPFWDDARCVYRKVCDAILPVTEDQVATLFAEEIAQRDYPCSEETIKKAFDFFGFKYKNEHIQMCRPDSEKFVNDWIAENA